MVFKVGLVSINCSLRAVCLFCFGLFSPHNLLSLISLFSLSFFHDIALECETG